MAHRYTAIYELDGNVLRNLFLCDKVGEMRQKAARLLPAHVFGKSRAPGLLPHD